MKNMKANNNATVNMVPAEFMRRLKEAEELGKQKAQFNHIIEDSRSFEDGMRITEIPLKFLHIPKYQRSKSIAKIYEISKNYDPRIGGVITAVINREELCFDVIIGQHRTEARKLAEKNEEVKMTVQIIEATESEAALLYTMVDLNTTKHTNMDVFKANQHININGHDKELVKLAEIDQKIKKVLDDFEITIASGTGKRTGGVSTLRKKISNERRLRETLEILCKAEWDGSNKKKSARLDSRSIDAVWNAVSTYEEYENYQEIKHELIDFMYRTNPVDIVDYYRCQHGLLEPELFNSDKRIRLTKVLKAFVDNCVLKETDHIPSETTITKTINNKANVVEIAEIKKAK